MSRRWIGIGAFIMILLIIGIVVVSKHPAAPLLQAPIESGDLPANPQSAHGAAPAAPIKAPLGVWVRPPAKVAARNFRRANFALLRRFGASEKLIDRLTDGDVLGVVTELKQQAQRGDPLAANILEYMAHPICGFASINGAGSPSRARELLDAQALPAQDAEWLGTAIQEMNAYDNLLAAACQQAIDQKEVEGWVIKSAEQGNSASLWLLSRFGGGRSAVFKEQKFMEAVDAGYPEAQALLAQRLTDGTQALPPDSAAERAENLFKEAAGSLPYAESLLAVCEFTGCPGIAADIPAAIAHAREAAQRGSFDAMIQIGPQLQASQIDKDEVAAWSLVGAMLAQQGCAYGGLKQWIKSQTGLTSNRVSDKARILADQYWKGYGTQMMANIGCSS